MCAPQHGRQESQWSNISLTIINRYLEFMKEKKWSNRQIMEELLTNVLIKNRQPWYHQAKNWFCMTGAEAHCTDCIYTQLSSSDPWLPLKAVCQKNWIKTSWNPASFQDSLVGQLLSTTWDRSNVTKFFALTFKDHSFLLCNRTFPGLSQLLTPN